MQQNSTTASHYQQEVVCQIQELHEIQAEQLACQADMHQFDDDL
jgi:hypothetical protein